MPVYFIAIDCDDDVDCALPGIRFHCVPLKRNRELAKQVRFGTLTHVRVAVATKPAIGEPTT